MAKGKMAEFDWADALRLEGLLSEEERAIRDAAAAYAQAKLQPRVLKAFRDEHFDREIMNELGELGLLGPTISTHGCANSWDCLRNHLDCLEVGRMKLQNSLSS